MLACGSLLMGDSNDVAKMSLPTNTVLLKVEELTRNHKLEVCIMYLICLYDVSLYTVCTQVKIVKMP